MPIRNRLLYSAITILVLLLVAAGYYLVKGGKLTNPTQLSNPFSSTTIILSASKGSNNQGSSSSSYDVYRFMTDGSNSKLTSADDANFKGGYNATFSPDGQRIAYVAVTASTGQQIAKMNLDGSGKTAVSKTPGYKQMPSWSADGKKIMYVLQAESGKSQVMQIDLAAGTETELLSAAVVGSPNWLPDSSGFIYQQSGKDEKGSHLILYKDGRSSEIVVKNGDKQVDDFLTPSVSPDGKSVAFIRTSDNQVYTVSLDGKNVKLLSSASHSIFSCVSWGPDNMYLVVAEYDRTNSKYYVSKVDVSSSNVSRWVESGFSNINCPRVARY